MYMGDTPRVVTLLLLVIACTLPGCATKQVYPGPELPRGEVAIISKKFGVSSVRILAVDGVKRGFWDIAFAVKPGKHTVTVRLQSCRTSYVRNYQYPITDPRYQYPTKECDYTPSSDLSFEAEANHTYVVHGTDFRYPEYWIVDEQTHQVVGRYP